MIKKLGFLLFLIGGFVGVAQPIQYSYDSYGNRTQRSLVVSDPQSQRTVQPAGEEKVKEIAKEMGLSVFPNPAQDKVNVVINNLKEDQEALVLLIDAQGKNLLNKNTSHPQNEVDMNGYKPGVYFIKVIIGKEVLFYKVLKL